MQNRLFPLILACIIPCAATMARSEPLVLENEAKTLRFSLEMEKGEPWYRIDQIAAGRTDEVVQRSPLGITRTDDAFTSGLTLVSSSEPRIVEDDYALVSGKQLKVRERGVERTFHFNNQRRASVDIVVRAYADGLAFRYDFPGKTTQLRYITHEATGFRLPTSGKAWVQPYSKVDVWAPAYESEYVNGVPVGTAAAAPEGWALPLLAQLPSAWVLITEAGLDGTYFGSHLEPKAEEGLYRLRPPEAPETYGVAPQSAAATLPWSSPWRLVVVGRDLNTIVRTTLVTTLARPTTFADLSWIKPGRASWSWWSDMSSPSDVRKMIPFIDVAADLRWEYSTVDLGWHELKEAELVELVSHASAKGVGLLLWYNSGGTHNRVDAGPRDLMFDPQLREAEMSRIARLGFKGLKVDFMQSDKQYVIQLYQDILEAAARHHLVVDFHGATLPRGWSRTYPNLLTMEAVSGAEQYWSDQYAENAQTINAIYPFTRNVVGSMDYTPMVFADAPHLKRHLTTNAHELALAVVFESGIQHLIDPAADLAAQPEYIKNFLRALPVAWDETVLVDGEPGKLAVLARRRGRDWFVAGINGERTPKSIKLPLTFLGAGKYKLSLITDGENPRSFSHEERAAESGATLEINLAARGGFAARFHRD